MYPFDSDAYVEWVKNSCFYFGMPGFSNISFFLSSHNILKYPTLNLDKIWQIISWKFMMNAIQISFKITILIVKIFSRSNLQSQILFLCSFNLWWYCRRYPQIWNKYNLSIVPKAWVTNLCYFSTVLKAFCGSVFVKNIFCQ